VEITAYRSLASRDLQRGQGTGLPSGEAVARAIGAKPLTHKELALGDWQDETPLWLYILREAAIQSGGDRLGEVGGRIVAGVLVYAIIGPQISGYAARAIAGRLEEQFAGRMPSPAELLAMDPATLKSVGLSQRKVEYVRSLAEHIISGELQIDRLHKLSDDA